MALESQSATFGRVITAGVPVFTSGASTAMSASTNKLASSQVAAVQTKLSGKTILAGLDIQSSFVQNGTAALQSTGQLSFAAAKTTLEATLSPPPTITFTTEDGTVRTATRDTSGEVGSQTFTFTKEATLAQTITVIVLNVDKTTTSKVFEASAVGFTNGSTTTSGNVGFAQYNTGDVSDADKSTSAASNLKAAIEAAGGFQNKLFAHANVASESDATTTVGRVYFYQMVPGTAGNTSLTVSDTVATATMTFTDKPDETTTITLVDSDGTSVVFEIDDSEDGVSGGNVAVTEIAENGGGGTGTAVDLAAKINAQAALNITAAAPGSGVLNLTHGGVVAAAGNTAITYSDSSWEDSITGTAPTALTGGIGFIDGTNPNPPSAFTGGVDSSGSFAAGTVNMAHSSRHAAYQLSQWINDTSNGLLTVTGGVSGEQVCTFTNDTAGTIGNTVKISYNSTWPSIMDVLPPANLSGGVDATTPNFGYELSIDGTTWTSTTDIISDVTATSTGLKLSTFTVPNNIPYIRFVFNTNGSDLGSTSGVIAFKYTGG